MGYVFATVIAFLTAVVGLVVLLLGSFVTDARFLCIPGAILFVGGMIMQVLIDLRGILAVHIRRMKDADE